MKSIKNYFPLITLIFILFIASCAPEETVTPADERDNIIGTYSCEETENGTNVTTFDITVRKSTITEDGLVIDNFYNIGNQYSINAIFSNNALAIKQQNVSKFGVVGDGKYNGSNKITFTYNVAVGGNNNNCTAVATKQ